MSVSEKERSNVPGNEFEEQRRVLSGANAVE
jgi:hypothetical protein